MPSVCIDEEDPTLWRERAKRRIERESGTLRTKDAFQILFDSRETERKE